MELRIRKRAKKNRTVHIDQALRDDDDVVVAVSVAKIQRVFIS